MSSRKTERVATSPDILGGARRTLRYIRVKLAPHLHGQTPEGWGLPMLAGAIAAVLLVFALFLSMLSSSPKDDVEWNPDTES